MGGGGMSGNEVLVEHGILTEQSDLRAHVCPRERKVYVFPTQCGVDAVRGGDYPLFAAHQPGVDAVTAMGCWVPPDEIPYCLAVSPRSTTWKSLRFSDHDSLGTKGQKALSLILGMIRNGLFPGSLGGEDITDTGMQIDGMDIIIQSTTLPERRVQVKCDYAGGRSGLYLQTEECNPLGIH